VGEMKFNIEKEVFGRKTMFNCEIIKDFDLKNFFIKISSDIFKKEVKAEWISSKQTLLFLDDDIYYKGKKIKGIKIDDRKIIEEIEKEKEAFYEKLKEMEKEEERQIEKEFQEFLQNEKYFKNEVKIAQGCDTGTFYICDIENEKIEKFVEEALNKYLNGLISSNWIPDYWLPNLKAKFEVNELIKEGKAKIIEDENSHKEYLILNADVVNEMVNMLKEEIRKEKEEEERKFEELKQKIQKERKVIIEQWSEPCCDPREECDVDVHYVYAFADEKEAREFAEKEKTNAFYDKELNAWKVHIWSHTW
jgi:tRNA uridine 5-carbamoylmethylation protein Kti12